jgi:hypothetical protein
MSGTPAAEFGELARVVEEARRADHQEDERDPDAQQREQKGGFDRGSLQVVP